MQYSFFATSCLIVGSSLIIHAQTKPPENNSNVRILLRDHPTMRSRLKRLPHDPWPSAPSNPSAKRLEFPNGLNVDRDTVFKAPPDGVLAGAVTSDLVIDADRIYVPKGITLKLRGYNRVFINSRRSVVIDGTIDA